MKTGVYAFLLAAIVFIAIVGIRFQSPAGTIDRAPIELTQSNLDSSDDKDELFSQADWAEYQSKSRQALSKSQREVHTGQYGQVTSVTHSVSAVSLLRKDFLVPKIFSAFEKRGQFELPVSSLTRPEANALKEVAKIIDSLQPSNEGAPLSDAALVKFSHNIDRNRWSLEVDDQERKQSYNF